MGKEKEFP